MLVLLGPAAQAQSYIQVEVYTNSKLHQLLITDSDGGFEKIELEKPWGGFGYKEKNRKQNKIRLMKELDKIRKRGYELVNVTSGGAGNQQLFIKVYFFRKRAEN